MRQEECGHIMVHEIRTFRKLHVCHEPADRGALQEAFVVDDADLGAQQRSITQVVEFVALDVRQKTYTDSLLQINVVAEVAGQNHPVKICKGHGD